MKCSRVQKLLPLYAGGDLTHHQADAVAEHLAQCETCRREADGYAAAVQALRQAGAEQPPNADWNECWQAVQPHLGETNVERRVLAFPRPTWRHVLRAAAMVLIALGIGMAIGWSLKSPASVTPVVAQQPQPTKPAPEAIEPESALAKAKANAPKQAPGPARRVFVLDELDFPGLVLGDVRSTTRSPRLTAVGTPQPRRGYYMDNIKLIGADRGRK